jgi:Zn-dependent peptidase ImmA (M78 family)
MAKSSLTSRREAILEGAKAAGILHQKLGLQNHMATRPSSIDVYSVIADLDIFLLFKALDGPLGLCLQGSSPGILINQGRPHMMQRFTAAHELGHIVMGHGGSIDHRIYEVVESSDNTRSLEEVSADAFASEFLLPRWLLIHHTRQQNWASAAALSDPSVIYQLSLRVGGSYQATAWSLKANGVLRDDQLQSILATQPKAHKKELLGKHELPNPWNDVWLLGPQDNGLSYPVRQGDYVALDLPTIPSAGFIWEMADLEKMGIAQVVADSHVPTENAQIGAVGVRRILMFMKEAGSLALSFQELRPWKRATSVRATFKSDLHVLRPEVGGLPNSSRSRLAS